MHHFEVKYQHLKNPALVVYQDFDADDYETAIMIAHMFIPEGFTTACIKEVYVAPERFKPELCKQLQLWVDGKSATEILKEMDDDN